MSSRPSGDRDVLPRSTVQRFGMLLVIVVLGAALLQVGDMALLGAVLTAGMTCVLLGGAYEKARHEMERVLAPEKDDPKAGPPS